MSESLRKTYKYTLKPTPEQERQLERVLWRCRTLYNTALEQRITLYKQRGVTLTRYTQEAELKDIRAEMSEYAAIHSHVLQDVLARLDKNLSSLFPSYPRRTDAGFPALSGQGSFQQFHLQGVWQRRAAG
jgi:putative transposase